MFDNTEESSKKSTFLKKIIKLIPLRSVIVGLKGYLDGLWWIKGKPLYLLMLFVPITVAIVVLVSILTALIVSGNELISSLIPFEASIWYLIPPYYLLWGVLAVMMFILSFIPPLLIANLLSSPLYEVVSCAVEREVRGSVVEISWRQALLAMVEEGKKIAFILLIMLLMFVVVFIPVLNLLTFPLLLVNAFLLGWDICDYPLARRGWTFRRRLHFAGKNFLALMGFGLWLLIPLQFVLAPLAVAGGTLLTLKLLPEE